MYQEENDDDDQPVSQSFSQSVSKKVFPVIHSLRISLFLSEKRNTISPPRSILLTNQYVTSLLPLLRDSRRQYCVCVASVVHNYYPTWIPTVLMRWKSHNNSTSPHYWPADRKLFNTQRMLMDWTVQLDGDQ